MSGTARCRGLLDKGRHHLSAESFAQWTKIELDILALADALIVDLLDVGQLLIGSGLVHAGAARERRKRLRLTRVFSWRNRTVSPPSLMSLPTDDGLHGRRSGLGQLCLGFLGEVRAFINERRRPVRPSCRRPCRWGCRSPYSWFLGRELKDIQDLSVPLLCSSFRYRPALRSTGADGLDGRGMTHDDGVGTAVRGRRQPW